MPTSVEELDRAGAGSGAAHAAVDDEGLGDLPLDGVERIERAHRLLEDHRDGIAADGAQGRRRRRSAGLSPLNSDAALRVRGGRVGQEAEDREGGDGLARAAFADQRHGLAGSDGEADAAHGVDHPLLGGEIDMQVFDARAAARS